MEANQSNQHNSLLASEADSQRTLYPYVTGTSVVAIKYKDGILMASDMGGSYGSTLRYKSVERIKPVGKHSLLGASGEISDFQEILRYLDELILYDNMWDDGNSLGPKEVHSYLTRVMYNRRNKFNPLWNSLILGGVKNGHKYLGMVSMIGVNFEDDHVATGFGNHLARPILRDEWHENLSFEDGVKLLEKCMRVLLYRDRSAINKLQIAKITEEGVTVSQPYSLKTFWGFSAFQNPTVGAEGSWLKGTGEYDKFYEEGIYNCAGCGTPLYKSTTKFNSGCGWPGAITRTPDPDGRRTEITCTACGGHLGHVFKGEGFKTPTDERHCVNSVSIKFAPANSAPSL